jgi:hypothetical protein
MNRPNKTPAMRSADLKRQHERGVCDRLLRALQVQASFERYGNDRDEPDVIYRPAEGGTLGIEVATAYYDDVDAKAEWTLARGVRPAPPGGIEMRAFQSPNDLLCERAQRELFDKCAKRYSGADRVWLCVEQHGYFTDRASLVECAQRLLVPTDHGFKAIYLTHAGTLHEGGEPQAVMLYPQT